MDIKYQEAKISHWKRYDRSIGDCPIDNPTDRSPDLLFFKPSRRE